MLNSVIRSRVYKEFSSDERRYWFDITNKAVEHHVDTLYYSVYIKNDDISLADSDIKDLVVDVGELHEAKRSNRNGTYLFHGLDVLGHGVKGGYSYGLSLADRYDIFIAQEIPNDKTPRIHVQLRTKSLVMDGLFESINNSLNKVDEILKDYGLTIADVVENRIDYAFHTNCIQKPLSVLGPSSLDKHYLGALRRFGNNGLTATREDDHISIDYVAFGRKDSNNVFLRCYEKTREVVENAYKDFFFQRWFERGLINRYDLFVLSKAYTLKSYSTGILVGQLEWYIEYGKDDELKIEFSHLLETCFIRSSNNDVLYKAVKGILPPTTKIFNIEFQTMRKFYYNRDDFYNSLIVDPPSGCRSEASRLYSILFARRATFEILLKELACFVKDRRDRKSEPCDWWRRIQTCKIKDGEDNAVLEVWREYSRKLNLDMQRRKLAGNVAAIGVMTRKSTEESSFGDDIFEAIALLNDNDYISGDLEKKLREIEYIGYHEIQRRKARQLAPNVKAALKREARLESAASSDDGIVFKPNIQLPVNPLYREYMPESYLPKDPEWQCIRCHEIYNDRKQLVRYIGQPREHKKPALTGLCKDCLRKYSKKKREERKKLKKHGGGTFI